ncbi:MAG: J domain-containing protein [Alphaproteobacteria bacterium]|nr:J domain-containing protein [Alphaproteobacteria bacterium]
MDDGAQFDAFEREPLETGSTRSPDLRMCDHPECSEEGLHRAPMSPDRLREYFWFCLAHVREYNKAWNYCADMSTEEVEDAVRNDVTWGRPTWPLGMMSRQDQRNANRAHPFQEQPFDDPLRTFGGTFGGPSGRSDRDKRRAGGEKPRVRGAMARHYRVLRLRPPVSLTALKARYKELAKRLHPDVNGGDKEAEERLKEINAAYAALKKTVLPSS